MPAGRGAGPPIAQLTPIGGIGNGYRREATW
jgi:hypothetical protein